MAGALFLRKQFAPTSIATRRTLAALTSLLHGFHHQPSISTQSTRARCLPFKFFQEVEAARGFHAPSGRLDFRASIASQAGFAVADYSDEEKARGSGGGDECLEISKLGIHEEVVSSLSKRGITKLFPIQRAVLEPAMQGRDMIGRAKTGTGKTLAFGIPIMDKIIRYNEKHGCGRNPLALALAPTRELARQVEKEFFESAPKLDTLCVYGGTPIGRQMSSLDRGVDVIVGTPGRVIDLMKRGALDLSEVQFVVLDEADQMLNVGFEEAVEVILEKLPRNRQSMMFSATMPSWILKLTQKYLRDPLTIDLVGDSDQKLAEGITLHSIVSDHRAKAAIVGPLIAEHAKGGKCIVFTQTKRDADNLAYAMGRENYKCEPLHGDIPQGQRERTLSRFRDGLINILVATDVAARGLDIPNVDLVIHYELPSTSEIFVHRSGRTGRAGKKGTAILIYTMEQARSVRLIERDVGCKFKELPKINVDGANPMLSIGAGGRYGAMGGGRFGNSGFGRAGGYGGSGLGRSGGYNESGFGRSGGYGGSSFGRSSNSGEPGPSRFGSYGNPTSSRSGGGYDGSSSRSSDNFGRSGSGRPGGQFGSFGRQDRSGGSGSFGSSGSGGGFGGSASSGFGNFGSGRSRGFGDTRPSQSSSFFGDAQSNDTKSF